MRSETAVIRSSGTNGFGRKGDQFAGEDVCAYDEVGEFECWASLLSLVHIFATKTPADVPSQPYLRATAVRRASSRLAPTTRRTDQRGQCERGRSSEPVRMRCGHRSKVTRPPRGWEPRLATFARSEGP